MMRKTKMRYNRDETAPKGSHKPTVLSTTSPSSLIRGHSYVTIASLDHCHCRRPCYHSVSLPLQHPAATWHPSRAIATIRLPPYRSTAVHARPASVPQE